MVQCIRDQMNRISFVDVTVHISCVQYTSNKPSSSPGHATHLLPASKTFALMFRTIKNQAESH